MYKNGLKRLIDFSITLLAFIVLSPVFICVFILLSIANNGKPFFYQQRPGKDEHLFRIIKFKTMNDKKDASGQLLPDGKRLTPVGKFIRKTSLDEIPQLLNVLMGDMSLIGPRPLLIKYLPYYTEEERKRHSVRPGITGLAQVSGRNNLYWDERLKKDIEYVENLSFTLDLKILWKTFLNIITSKDIVIDPHSTMESLDEARSGKTA
jgi:undecaprenyl phosphate N,N'-diacetylbacillosamine 1-phosphate transferase